MLNYMKNRVFRRIFGISSQPMTESPENLVFATDDHRPSPVATAEALTEFSAEKS